MRENLHSIGRVLRFAGCMLLLVGMTGCGGIRPPRRDADRVVSMEITAYCPCGTCCGWERNWRFQPVHSHGPNKGKRKEVGRTASGTQARPGTLAADTRLYPFGTIMYVPGYGYGRVEDRGGAIRGERLDVFFRSHREALEWGRQRKDVKVWLPRD
jgi:3D (Asp-Asp-Asp) domain-containing protein